MSVDGIIETLDTAELASFTDGNGTRLHAVSSQDLEDLRSLLAERDRYKTALEKIASEPYKPDEFSFGLETIYGLARAALSGEGAETA